MPDASERPSGAPPDDTPSPNEVTEERARMLASHARYVQGGFSTPEVEAERARAQLAQSPGSIDWAKMEAEVDDALAAEAKHLASEMDDAAASGVPDGLPMDKVARYRELRDAEKAAGAEAAALKEEANALEAELIDLFADAGMQSINVDGKTVYLHRRTFAQRIDGATAEDVKAALLAVGADELVTETVNAQTLSAWVRELVDAAEDGRGPGLPDEVAKVLALGEAFSLRIVASGSKARR